MGLLWAATIASSALQSQQRRAAQIVQSMAACHVWKCERDFGILVKREVKDMKS